MARLNSQEKAELVAALTDQGVPENIARYAVDQEPGKGPYWRSSFLALFLLIAGFAVGAFALWVPLEALNNKLAAAHAETSGALLYRTNFGVSLLFALFGWIFMLMPIVAGVQLWSRTRRTSSFLYGMLDSNSGFSWFKLPDENLSPDQYIKAFFRRMAKLWFVPAAILLGLAAIIAPREVYTYDTFGEEGFTVSTLTGSKTYDLEDIRYVELGCNHVTGKNASDDLVYRIRFIGGKTIYMENATPVSGTWLENARQIDAALEAGDVRLKRWSWNKRNPMHPKCLDAQRRRHTPEQYQQILTLIRADDL